MSTSWQSALDGFAAELNALETSLQSGTSLDAFDYPSQILRDSPTNFDNLGALPIELAQRASDLRARAADLENQLETASQEIANELGSTRKARRFGGQQSIASFVDESA